MKADSRRYFGIYFLFFLLSALFLTLFPNATEYINNVFASLVTSFRSNGLTSFFLILTRGTEVIPAIAILILLLVPLFFKKYLLPEFGILYSIIFAIGLTWLGKYLFSIERPEAPLILVDGYSFPSAHASASWAYAVSFYVWLKETTLVTKYYTHTVVVFLFILAVLISLSRVYLGVHTFIDILAGSFLGIASVYASRVLLSEKN